MKLSRLYRARYFQVLVGLALGKPGRTQTLAGPAPLGTRLRSTRETKLHNCAFARISGIDTAALCPGAYPH